MLIKGILEIWSVLKEADEKLIIYIHGKWKTLLNLNCSQGHLHYRMSQRNPKVQNSWDSFEENESPVWFAQSTEWYLQYWKQFNSFGVSFPLVILKVNIHVGTYLKSWNGHEWALVPTNRKFYYR
jgi:hypothetical protein